MGSGSVDVKVCAVPCPEEVSEEERLDPFSMSAPVKLYRPPHLSKRIPAQQGVFTLHRCPTDSWQPSGMITLRIARGVCGHLKDCLNGCAINRATLFPGLDGLSDNLRWRYKWQRPL